MDRFDIYHNLNNYVKEIHQMEQENLENQPSLLNNVDSSSRKRKQANLEEYDDDEYDEN